MKSGKTAMLSLCMIVKNEEAFLEGCLQSVQGVVGEIVIADTGSTDRTKEIAARYAARVVDVPWVGDFAVARNEALLHAKGDWILYLDADERLILPRRDALDNLLAKHDVGAYTLLVKGDHWLPSGKVSQVNAYPRLFRKLPGVRFEGRVHEQVLPSILKTGKRIVASAISIEHLGYAQSYDIVREKTQRNIELLRQEVELHPHDGYTRHQIGNSLSVLGNYDEAKVELELTLRIPTVAPSIKASTLNLLAEIAIRQNRLGEAEDFCRQSLALAPQQSMARWFSIAILVSNRQYDEALRQLESLRFHAKAGGAPQVAHDVVLAASHIDLQSGVCWEGKGDYARALDSYFQAAVADQTTDQSVLKIVDLLEATGDPATAVARLERLEAAGITHPLVLSSLATWYWRSGDRSKAFSELHRARAANPKESESYVSEMAWHLEAGNPDAARLVLEQAEHKARFDYQLHRCSFDVSMQTGDLKGALRHVEGMISHTPEENGRVREKLIALAEKLSSRLSPVEKS